MRMPHPHCAELRGGSKGSFVLALTNTCGGAPRNPKHKKIMDYPLTRTPKRFEYVAGRETSIDDTCI